MTHETRIGATVVLGIHTRICAIDENVFAFREPTAVTTCARPMLHDKEEAHAAA